jgi:tetratricopeptide (TPR) repeat protein
VLFLEGRYREAAKEALLAVSSQPDAYERALSLVAVGQMETYAGRYKRAFVAFEQARQLANQFPEDLYLWTHFFGIRAITYRRTGRFDEAIIDWEGAADMLRSHGHFWRSAAYLNNIGFLLAKMGLLGQAEQKLLEALDLVDREPNPNAEATICDSLGYTYARLGQYINAERFLRKSVRLFEKLTDDAQLVGSLLHLSEFHERIKHYETARSDAVRALQLAVQIKSESLIADSRDRLKRIALAHLDESFNPVLNAHHHNCSLVKRVKPHVERKLKHTDF